MSEEHNSDKVNQLLVAHPTLVKSQNLKDGQLCDINRIRGNDINQRDGGACPQLTKDGYGLFRRLPGSVQPCLFELWRGNDEQRAEYAHLIRNYEPRIAGMADDLAKIGQIHSQVIRPLSPELCQEHGLPEGEYYDLTDGASRLCAFWLLRCEGKDWPVGNAERSDRFVRVVLRDETDEAARRTSFSSNYFALGTNTPAAEAEYCARRARELKEEAVKSGKKAPKKKEWLAQISAETGIEPQTVDSRVTLYEKLSDTDFERLRSGGWTLSAAMKKVKGKPPEDETASVVKVSVQMLKSDYLHEPRAGKDAKQVKREKITEEVRKYLAEVLNVTYSVVATARKAAGLPAEIPETPKPARVRRTKADLASPPVETPAAAAS